MKFRELQEYQQYIIANGCGGKGGVITPPNAEFFEDACNEHDLRYYLGFNEDHRAFADRRLREDMIEKIDFMPIDAIRRLMLPISNLVPDFLVKFLFKRWADLYYIGVRTFGWRFFYYDDREQELP